MIFVVWAPAAYFIILVFHSHLFFFKSKERKYDIFYGAALRDKNGRIMSINTSPLKEFRNSLNRKWLIN